MGQIQHTKESRGRAKGWRLGWRTCLRKGCGRRFQARRHNQRYCREPECQKELHRWQAAKRQQRRRAAPEGRRQHAEAERQRRKRNATREDVPQEGQAAATVAAEPARGHAARKHPEVFCDRPGCYEAVRGSSCAPASYCGDDCRTAMNRVRDRERKWLLRNRPAGRIKRHLEYQAARARRSRAHVLLSVSAAAPSSQPSQPLPSAVVNSGSVNGSRLDFKDSREMNRHDSQTDSCFRPRAPPADGRLVVD